MHIAKHSHKNLYTCWTPWSALQKKGLWARPPVLTPVPSQAIHSSPPIFMLGSLVRISQQQRWKNRKKHAFLSVTGLELRTGGRDLKTRSSRSHFPRDEMDIVRNSQVRLRTVMASGAQSDTKGGMMFNWIRLWLWAATLHGDRKSRRLRPWTSSTHHGDFDSHKKLSQLMSHFRQAVPSRSRRWLYTPDERQEL